MFFLLVLWDVIDIHCASYGAQLWPAPPLPALSHLFGVSLALCCWFSLWLAVSIREPILGNGARLNDLLGVISSTSSPFNFLADLLDSESEIVKESAYKARNKMTSAYLYSFLLYRISQIRMTHLGQASQKVPTFSVTDCCRPQAGETSEK